MYCLIEVVAKTGLTSCKFNYHTITITMTAGKERSTVLMKRTYTYIVPEINLIQITRLTCPLYWYHRHHHRC